MERPEELSEREILQEIAEEERLILIHQADLALQREQPPLSSLPGDVEEQDWLETLDALQSSGSQKLESKSQDDPVIHRLLPLVGGVTFTSVSALEPRNADTRAYEFQGATKSQLSFIVTAEVKLTEGRASVVDLKATFGSPPSEELERISKVAKETCCTTLLFRHLVTWADFDARRTALLLELQEKSNENAVKRLSRETFVLQITDTCSINDATTVSLCSLELMWRWRCSQYEQEGEELSLIACTVSSKVRMNQSELAQCVREIENPQGLDDLVASTGSCQNAIHLLVQLLLGK